MKVTDVKVTMFNWEQEAWTTGIGGGRGTSFGGDVLLGILTVETDEGISGNAFLGSSHQGADDLVAPLMKFLKPIVMGRNPMERGAIWWEMWRENRRVTTSRNRRYRCRTVGHRGQGCRPADSPAYRHMPL